MRSGCVLLLAACCLCAATFNENESEYDNMLDKATPAYVKSSNKHANTKITNYDTIKLIQEGRVNSIASVKKPTNSFRVSKNVNNDFDMTASVSDVDTDQLIRVTVTYNPSNNEQITNKNDLFTNPPSAEQAITNDDDAITNYPSAEISEIEDNETVTNYTCTDKTKIKDSDANNNSNQKFTTDNSEVQSMTTNLQKKYNGSAIEENDQDYKNQNNTIEMITASDRIMFNVLSSSFTHENLYTKTEPSFKINKSFVNSTIENEKDLKNDTNYIDIEEDELTTDNDYYTSSDESIPESSTNEYFTNNENDIISDRLAYQQYKAETNYVPRNEDDKYAQILASYRFMSVVKGNDWIDFDDEHHIVNPATSSTTTTIRPNSDELHNFENNKTPNNEEISSSLVDTQRSELLEFVALDTFRTFKTDKHFAEPLFSVTASSDDEVVEKEVEVPESIKPDMEMEPRNWVYGGYHSLIGAFDKSSIPLVDHKYYKSRFINDSKYFKEHWDNITNSEIQMIIHPPVLTTAFEHSYMHKLRFVFPYFGHNVTNITISTSGYIMTGIADRTWFADGEGLLPFMTNFDITRLDDFALILYDELDRLTVIWQDIPLFGNRDSRYTFSATLYSGGDVTFSYKYLPISPLELLETDNLMEIGLADSYYMKKDSYYSWHKISHSYTRLSFEKIGVVSGTVLELQAQPACPQHTSCSSCIGHSLKYSNFECVWCKKLQKCSSGFDYNRPLLSACNFTDSCDEPTEQPDSSSTVYNFLEKLFYM